MRRRVKALLLLAVFAALLVLILFKWIPALVSSSVYRTEYEEEVERYSAEFSVDPALVYSVIKIESNFNPEAKSDAGAIGLMQIIEESFDWVAWRLDRTDLSFEDMYIPENSIMFGCYMLGYLWEKYQNIELVAAAYHSGMSTVDGWIESGAVDLDNVLVENMKGANTQHYVKKILRAYKNYSNK